MVKYTNFKALNEDSEKNFSFIMVYKDLFDLKISISIVMVYSLLLNRWMQSQKNPDVFSNEDGIFCRYSQEDIAQTLNISLRSVSSAIAVLKNLKMIRTVNAGGGNDNFIYVEPALIPSGEFIMVPRATFKYKLKPLDTLVYGVYRSLYLLSLSNAKRFTDKQGNVFCLKGQQELSVMFKKGTFTLRHSLKRLIRLGLLSIKKVTTHVYNFTYVMDVNAATSLGVTEEETVDNFLDNSDTQKVTVNFCVSGDDRHAKTNCVDTQKLNTIIEEPNKQNSYIEESDSVKTGIDFLKEQYEKEVFGLEELGHSEKYKIMFINAICSLTHSNPLDDYRQSFLKRLEQHYTLMLNVPYTSPYHGLLHFADKCLNKLQNYSDSNYIKFPEKYLQKILDSVASQDPRYDLLPYFDYDPMQYC